ncbi:Retrovirus-related Pol poly from transposon [Brachionus plicatilis]|uniref:Retrovirus-related Pol poly from transposon n=1 Tax=Brachionus plicatilis TaxID=10195 RepID=A0A3M7QYB2_BRAPC|nr:Retrovirus-related Pol poly from transposon [Brachionus plicatilis]
MEWLVARTPELFSGKLGCAKDISVKLDDDPNVRPVRQPQRPVAFHLREAVGRELDEQGILEPVDSSSGPTPWVSNLVVVPKDKTAHANWKNKRSRFHLRHHGAERQHGSRRRHTGSPAGSNHDGRQVKAEDVPRRGPGAAAQAAANRAAAAATEEARTAANPPMHKKTRRQASLRLKRGGRCDEDITVYVLGSLCSCMHSSESVDDVHVGLRRGRPYTILINSF